MFFNYLTSVCKKVFSKKLKVIAAMGVTLNGSPDIYA